ncbi:hypothetical protein Trydic_g12705 [Trypoxylus dichotomus]
MSCPSERRGLHFARRRRLYVAGIETFPTQSDIDRDGHKNQPRSVSLYSSNTDNNVNVYGTNQRTRPSPESKKEKAEALERNRAEARLKYIYMRSNAELRNMGKYRKVRDVDVKFNQLCN